MKLYQILIVFVLTSSVLYGSAAAEYQDDKRFGNGRLLRRLRGDTAKKTPPKTKESKDAVKNKKVDARGKTPTPAGKRPGAQVPTPATKRPSVRVPTPASRTGFDPITAGSRANASSRLTAVRPSAATPKSNTAPSSTAKPKAAKRPDQAVTDFGMQLENKSDSFRVKRVDPKGNAQEAGIKKGDVILEAGGVKLDSMEGFEEIASILGQGDQLEFKVERRGKKMDVLIQFGTTPEVPANAETSSTKNENDFSREANHDDKPHAGLNSVLSQRQSNLNKPAASLRQNDTSQIVEQQRMKIEKMQQEIERLKQQAAVVPNEVDATGAKSVITDNLSDGPSLLGPGK